MDRIIEKARKMLIEWKGDSYAFGFDVLGQTGEFVSRYGKRALLIVADLSEAWVARTATPVMDSLETHGVEFEAVTGARPNAPREDLYRLALHVARSRPEVLVAVQTAASSGAHLTKYSNITDLVTGQKKLIVDEAIVPPAAVFDYGVTLDSPIGLTLDGGLAGIAP